jgi:hypothetical protein
LKRSNLGEIQNFIEVSPGRARRDLIQKQNFKLKKVEPQDKVSPSRDRRDLEKLN